MSEGPTVKRWTAKRKAAVVMDIFKGKITVTEVARHQDLTVSEVESWISEAQRNMENGFKARPKDIREQDRILQLKRWQVRQRPRASDPVPGACLQSQNARVSAGPRISPTSGAARIAAPVWPW